MKKGSGHGRVEPFFVVVLCYLGEALRERSAAQFGTVLRCGILREETEVSMKKLLLIDGSSLLFRAFYALPLLTNAEGVYTNGVYGFLTMLRKVLNDEEPTHVLVAFDRPDPTFRHEAYKAYKGTREKAPSELAGQFAITKDLLETMGLKHFDMAGYEADDVLGTMARKGEKEGYEVVLVTGDRDYYQLVDENTTLLLTKRGASEMETWTPAHIREHFGIEPRDFIEVKALMGDPSDNIPGIPGIGEKRALQYVREYGSLEGLYEHIDEVRGPKTRLAIEENKDLAYLSRKLGTIHTEVPMDLTFEDLIVGDPDRDELNRKLRKLGMTSLITEGTEAAPESHLEASTLEDVLEDVKEEGSFTYLFLFDDDYLTTDPVALGLASKKRVTLLKHDEFPEAEPFFRTARAVSMDVKPSLRILDKFEFAPETYDDVSLLIYLSDPASAALDPFEGAKKIGENVRTDKEILGKGVKKKKFADLSEEKLLEIFSERLSVTRKLCEKLLEELRVREMKHLYRDVELPLVRILYEMESTGFPVDVKKLEFLSEDFRQEVETYEKEIYELAGEEFNIQSPKQLGVILFEKLGLPVIKKTKTGYSTDVEVLTKLAPKHEIAEKILEFRTLAKLKSTYVDALIPLIDEKGRIHTHLNQTVTATGRISSTEPNLQNIPVRDENGRRIRDAFVAEPGYLLIDADYSQIELRVLAHLADDAVMQDAFRHGIDIHAKTASEVFGVAVDEVTPLERRAAKAVNFGIVYGISDYGLSQDLGITRKEAKRYIDGYLATYPNIRDYMESIVESSKEKGYVETILNRRRYIPELKSKNFAVRSFGERVALNMPIQGSAADIIKLAMVRVYDRLQSENLKAELLLQVHDELIVHAPEEEADEVARILEEEMTGAFSLKVDLIAEVHRGKNWNEAK